MTTETVTVDFPEWALPYLVNGDASGLEDSDLLLVGEWLQGMLEEGYSGLDYEVTEDRNEFCPHPEFGLACSTVKVMFFKRKENDEMDDIMKVYVIQDCVDNDGDCYSFKCDVSVRLSLEAAVKEAWRVFASHYSRIAGHQPSDEIRTEFEDAMSREDGKRYYEIDASETKSVTVEILERSVR